MPKLKKTGTIHDTLTGYDFRVDDPLPLRKAARQKCLECVCGSSEEVRRCHIYDCALWPWRLGRGVTNDPEGKTVKVKKVKAPTAKSLEALRAFQGKRHTQGNHPTESAFVAGTDVHAEPERKTGRSGEDTTPNQGATQ